MALLVARIAIQAIIVPIVVLDVARILEVIVSISNVSDVSVMGISTISFGMATSCGVVALCVIDARDTIDGMIFS